jgi:quercetin dioxygenase-like cupin family protein
MANVTPLANLSFSQTAKLWQGGDDVPVSIFVTEYERGQGVGLHVHPYPEVFVVQTGTGKFTVGEEQVTIDAGHILVVPAETQHGFEGAGDDTLIVVSVHPSGKVEQTFLE